MLLNYFSIYNFQQCASGPNKSPWLQNISLMNRKCYSRLSNVISIYDSGCIVVADLTVYVLWLRDDELSFNAQPKLLGWWLLEA